MAANGIYTLSIASASDERLAKLISELLLDLLEEQRSKDSADNTLYVRSPQIEPSGQAEE